MDHAHDRAPERRDRTRIKICGLARPEDARIAAGLGADFLGLVLAESPRRVDLDDARRWMPEVRAEFPSCRWVGVFVRPSAAEVAEAVEALGLDLVQVHGLAGGRAWPGEEGAAPAVPWICAVGEREAPDWLRARAGSPGPAPWAVLVDTSSGGGTGRAFDWTTLRNRVQQGGYPTSGEELGPPGRDAGGSLRLFIAGGLAADNVGRAIVVLRPYAVDASSRLEVSPGRKDPEKLRAFVAAVARASGGTTHE